MEKLIKAAQKAERLKTEKTSGSSMALDPRVLLAGAGVAGIGAALLVSAGNAYDNVKQRAEAAQREGQNQKMVQVGLPQMQYEEYQRLINLEPLVGIYESPGSEPFGFYEKDEKGNSVAARPWLREANPQAKTGPRIMWSFIVREAIKSQYRACWEDWENLFATMMAEEQQVGPLYKRYSSALLALTIRMARQGKYFVIKAKDEKQTVIMPGHILLALGSLSKQLMTNEMADMRECIVGKKAYEEVADNDKRLDQAIAAHLQELAGNLYRVYAGEDLCEYTTEGELPCLAGFNAISKALNQPEAAVKVEGYGPHPLETFMAINLPGNNPERISVPLDVKLGTAVTMFLANGHKCPADKLLKALSQVDWSTTPKKVFELIHDFAHHCKDMDSYTSKLKEYRDDNKIQKIFAKAGAFLKQLETHVAPVVIEALQTATK